jgi:hypothetical protein
MAILVYLAARQNDVVDLAGRVQGAVLEDLLIKSADTSCLWGSPETPETPAQWLPQSTFSAQSQCQQCIFLRPC